MDRVTAARGFDRFYTQFVGALDPRFLGSDMSLAEARILFELAPARSPVAADLQVSLGMDAGHVSRVLRRFEAAGLIVRERGEDGRRRPIALTAAGRATFASIDERQHRRLEAMLAPLGPRGRANLVAALGAARALLEPTNPEKGNDPHLPHGRHGPDRRASSDSLRGRPQLGTSAGDHRGRGHDRVPARLQAGRE